MGELESVKQIIERGGLKTTGEYPYPSKDRGWVCYHCGERLTTWGAAEDHFGKTPDKVAGCIIQAGEPRRLLMELRKAEVLVDLFYARARAAEDQVDALNGELAEYRRIAGGGTHELRMRIDSLEGEAITARTILEAVRTLAPKVYHEVIR